MRICDHLADDWEKLSDVDNQVDQSKKKAEKEETDGVEADSSKLSEVEVPRSNNRKETEVILSQLLF